MDKRTTNKKGQPDFLFVYRGRPIGLEVKLPGKMPTEDQVRVMDAMVKDGWTVTVVRSLGEVVQVLRAAVSANQPELLQVMT
jgi:hypothetical protein